MIAEGVLAVEYGASAEDIARTCHAHVSLPYFLRRVSRTHPLSLAHSQRGLQGGRDGRLRQAHPFLSSSHFHTACPPHAHAHVKTDLEIPYFRTPALLLTLFGRRLLMLCASHVVSLSSLASLGGCAEHNWMAHPSFMTTARAERSICELPSDTTNAIAWVLPV